MFLLPHPTLRTIQEPIFSIYNTKGHISNEITKYTTKTLLLRSTTFELIFPVIILQSKNSIIIIVLSICQLLITQASWKKLCFPIPWLCGCLKAENINYNFTTELFVQSCILFLSRSSGPLNQVPFSAQQKLYSL